MDQFRLFSSPKWNRFAWYTTGRSSSVDVANFDASSSPMCLIPSSRALRRLRLSHSASRHAPRSVAAGLWNPASCDPVLERGNKVFEELSHVTVGSFFILDVNDYFPDSGDLYGRMATDANTSS